MVERMCLFDSLLAEPDGDLVVGNNGCACVSGNFDGIGDVVEVTMRNEDVVSLDALNLDVTGEGVRRNEWVKEERFASDLHGKAGVTVVGKLHCRDGFVALNRFTT